MSKTYACRVKRDIYDRVREQDRVVYGLRLLPVGDREKMKAWVREELLKEGGDAQPDGRITWQQDGVRVTVDLEKEEVEVRAESGDDVRIHIDKDEKVYNAGDNRQAAQTEAERRVDAEIEKRKLEAREAHKQKAFKLLRKAEGKVKARIRQAENKAIERALDQKGDELGRLIEREATEDADGNQRVVWQIEMGSGALAR